MIFSRKHVTDTVIRKPQPPGIHRFRAGLNITVAGSGAITAVGVIGVPHIRVIVTADKQNKKRNTDIITISLPLHKEVLDIILFQRISIINLLENTGIHRL